MDTEIFIDDSKLRNYVDDVFAEAYRESSYRSLLKAKNTPKAQIAYFNFVNAYLKDKKSNQFGNICCLAVDLAKNLLRDPIRPKKQRHKRKW